MSEVSQKRKVGEIKARTLDKGAQAQALDTKAQALNQNTKALATQPKSLKRGCQPGECRHMDPTSKKVDSKGVAYFARKHKAGELLPHQRAWLRDYITRGMSTKQIAKKYGVLRTTVRRRIDTPQAQEYMDRIEAMCEARLTDVGMEIKRICARAVEVYDELLNRAGVEDQVMRLTAKDVLTFGGFGPSSDRVQIDLSTHNTQVNIKEMSTEQLRDEAERMLREQT